MAGTHALEEVMFLLEAPERHAAAATGPSRWQPMSSEPDRRTVTRRVSARTRSTGELAADDIEVERIGNQVVVRFKGGYTVTLTGPRSEHDGRSVIVLREPGRDEPALTFEYQPFREGVTQYRSLPDRLPSTGRYDTDQDYDCDSDRSSSSSSHDSHRSSSRDGRTSSSRNSGCSGSGSGSAGGSGSGSGGGSATSSSGSTSGNYRDGYGGTYRDSGWSDDSSEGWSRDDIEKWMDGIMDLLDELKTLLAKLQGLVA